MPYNFKIGLLCLILPSLLGCIGQNQVQRNDLSDDFDKTMPFYYKMPENLSSEDKSPAWNQKGQKLLLTGTVYEIDGKTPLPNTIIYYYHTDSSGKYAIRENEERNMPQNQLGQTHGYIRGWVKTDEAGKYSIFTIKPGTYPSRDEPAHIHFTVKEPATEEPYYIDDVVFDEDKLLTSERRNKMENRGGSGIIRFVQKEGLKIGERNIILGLNVPDHPKNKTEKLHSGKNIGEDINSFNPFHAYGPDAGTTTCPICKYGWYHGILFFVGNNPNWTNIKKWLVFLEAESNKRGDYLKVYFVYGNESDYSKDNRTRQLKQLGNELKLQKTALTFVPSFSDKNSEIHLNEIDQKVDNTFLIYRRSNIIAKYVDIKPNDENFERIIKQLDQTINEYFRLPKSK